MTCSSLNIGSVNHELMTIDSILLSNHVIIISPININIIHNAFLNTLFGFEIHLSLDTNFCQKIAISNITKESPRE